MPMSLAPTFSWAEDEVLDGDASPSAIIHQTSTTTVRRRRLAGTSIEVVALSFRACHEKHLQLWENARRLLNCPLHPVSLVEDCFPERTCSASGVVQSFVSVLGVTGKKTSLQVASTMADSTPSSILMEMMTTSLHDVLHVDKLQLASAEILFIATEVLTALQYLHVSGQAFGSTLTSRKVMFGGSRHVKLRRYCSEWVAREAEAQRTDSVWKSQYAMPQEDGLEGLPELGREQRRDLYAFGMLLLEMCSGEKPNVESVNSISLASRVDPRLESIIRTTLMLDDSNFVKASKTDAVHDPHEVMNYCTRILEDCGSSSDSSITDSTKQADSHFQSTREFKSFLHADRFVRSREDHIVERRVLERTAQSAVALKRLAAVEEDLVEEQKNFDVVVKQLERLRIEKSSDESRIRGLLEAIQQCEAQLKARNDVELALRAELDAYHAKMAAVEVELEHARSSLQRAHADHRKVDCERQELLVEVLRLKDEKRLCLDQKLAVQRQLLEESAKVGGEKEALEELEARWRQAVHRCEQEQLTRRSVERQLEALSQQLTAMEDERSQYTGALQMAPTGQLDARASRYLVLELKDKEVANLREVLKQVNHDLSDARDQLAACTEKSIWLEQSVCADFHGQINQLKLELASQCQQISALTQERDSLRLGLDSADRHTNELQTTISTLQTEVRSLQTQVADAEKARRLRQCLTPNCDAPRYLVKTSGFCIDCEEKMAKERGKLRAAASSSPPSSSSTAIGRGSRGHRRQKSLDGIRAILNSSRNTTIIELVKRIEVARDCDDESREESCLELVSVVKQLGKVLKESPTLKEDLPECGVLRSMLSVVEQFISTLPTVLECFKTLSIIVFNHDRNRLILVAEGAVEIVLRVMKEFSREVKVQEAGAVLLTNLSHNCESNRQRILAAGGVEAVLDLMQSFPRDKNAQKKSCWALLTLAGSDVMCEKIASLGGVGATLAAMLNCPDDEDVQHYGCWALLNLIVGTRDLQEFARREGVGEVAEAALACFPEHIGIQQKCGEILELLHQNADISS